MRRVGGGRGKGGRKEIIEGKKEGERKRKEKFNYHREVQSQHFQLLDED